MAYPEGDQKRHRGLCQYGKWLYMYPSEQIIDCTFTNEVIIFTRSGCNEPDCAKHRVLRQTSQLTEMSDNELSAPMKDMFILSHIRLGVLTGNMRCSHT